MSHDARESLIRDYDQDHGDDLDHSRKQLVFWKYSCVDLLEEAHLCLLKINFLSGR